MVEERGKPLAKQRDFILKQVNQEEL
ncbi:hypothetical protein HNY73_008643 [Argiope bruennichi]|uniref:Uncharacterized protein n=1 Tax=Argiope bruennichi TaxID=94029 RepID=A0A8T0F732_ARGBR|nr:hypothetical protein HNY73_008643 [Argiope bruennichi]